MVNNILILEYNTRSDLEKLLQRTVMHCHLRRHTPHHMQNGAQKPKMCFDEDGHESVCPRRATDMLSYATLSVRHGNVKTNPNGSQSMKNGRRWHDGVNIKRSNTSLQHII